MCYAHFAHTTSLHDYNCRHFKELQLRAITLWVAKVKAEG